MELGQAFERLSLHADEYEVTLSSEPASRRHHVFRALVDAAAMVKAGLVADVPVVVSRNGTDLYVARLWPSRIVAPKSVELPGDAAALFGVSAGDRVSWRPAPVAKLASSITACAMQKSSGGIAELLLAARHIVPGQRFHASSLSGPFQIEGTEHIVALGPSTTIQVKPPPSAARSVAPAGLEREAGLIKDHLLGWLRCKGLYAEHNVRPLKGMLLYGPPGTGKTLLATTIGTGLGLTCISIDGSDISSKYYGDSEAKLRRIFEDAVSKAPALLFIDEIDAICPRRESTGGTESRLVATLLALMDGLQSASDPVFILAATNNPSHIDPALRRPGRLDREIEIGVPTAVARAEIIKSHLALQKHSLSEDQIQAMAARTHGFVGADLALLVKEATLLMVGRADPAAELAYQDFERSIARVKPSALRDVALELGTTKWEDIAGLELTKSQLREAVELPLKCPESFARLSLRPPKGILLYGPPGCSKTLLARALAHEAGVNFLAVKGPELLSKWVGDSEKAINDIFRKARVSAPSIVFFDEFDAIGCKRSEDGSNSVGDRVLSQILCELDGVDPLISVTVVAATNRPDILDPALLRPGRFDRQIYIPLPDQATRLGIFRLQSQRAPFDESIDFDALSKQTQGYSGAEIAHICQEAAYKALTADRTSILQEDLLAVVADSPCRVSQAELKYYEDYANRLKPRV